MRHKRFTSSKSQVLRSGNRGRSSLSLWVAGEGITSRRREWSTSVTAINNRKNISNKVCK